MPRRAVSAREAGDRVSARGVVSPRPLHVLLVLLAHQADAHRPPTSQYELQAADQLERVPTACPGNAVIDGKAALKEVQKCDSIGGSLAIMYGASGLFAKGKIELKKLKVVGGHLMVRAPSLDRLRTPCPPCADAWPHIAPQVVPYRGQDTGIRFTELNLPSLTAVGGQLTVGSPLTLAARHAPPTCTRYYRTR